MIPYRYRKYLNILYGMGRGILDMRKGLEHYQTRLKETLTKIEQIEVAAHTAGVNVLFLTVGRALTAWSKMEEFLVIIVAILLRTTTDKKAGVLKTGILMYNIYNFANWLTVIHDLFALDPELAKFQKTFGKITEKLKKIKDMRDRLAHHSVQSATSQIRPSALDGRTKSKGQRPLSVGEVGEFTEKVLDIADELEALMKTMLAEVGASLDKSDEQPSGQSSQSGSQ